MLWNRYSISFEPCERNELVQFFSYLKPHNEKPHGRIGFLPFIIMLFRIFHTKWGVLSSSDTISIPIRTNRVLKEDVNIKYYERVKYVMLDMGGW